MVLECGYESCDECESLDLYCPDAYVENCPICDKCEYHDTCRVECMYENIHRYKRKAN